MRMIVRQALVALILVSTSPGIARAQAWQPRLGEPAVEPHHYQVEQHRIEMDRLRAGADQRDAFARRLAHEARLNRLRLEATHQPEAAPRTGTGAVRSLEVERAMRFAAADRRRTAMSGLGQIDAWLDRSRE